MPKYIHIPELQSEVLQIIHDMLHGIRKDRSIESRFPSLRYYLGELKTEVDSYRFPNVSLKTDMELRKDISLMNRSLQKKVEALEALWGMHYGKKTPKLFPFRYHVSSLAYYQACLQVCNENTVLQSLLASHSYFDWNGEDLKKEIEQFASLLAFRFPPQEEKQARSRIIAVRDMLKALERIIY